MHIDKTIESKELLYEDEVSKVFELTLVRKKMPFLYRLFIKISSPKIHLVQFKKSHGNFKVNYNNHGSTSFDHLNQETFFSVNSAFYTEDGKTVGEVIVNGKSYGKRTRSTGFFKVIDDQAFVGPRSVFNAIYGKVSYSCQAHPSLMKNGQIWSYILKENMRGTFWTRRTYRNLSGMDNNGQIYFLLSGFGGLISVKESAQLAKALGIKTATLFDGGSALQYAFNKQGFKLSFQAYNNSLNMGNMINNISKKLFGKVFYNTSPVFIVCQNNKV